MRPARKFKLIDCVLAVVCVVLTIEAAAPAASVGKSQIFWWLFLLPTFCLPYSLISAELGTTYPSEGGIYDWVTRAFGPRWGTRVAWYYWLNFPLWMASIAVFFTDNFPQVFGIAVSPVAALVIRLVFIWLVIALSQLEAADNKWFFNIGTVVKVGILAAVGIGGILYAARHGAATDYSLRNMLPTLEFGSLASISVIIYNFMGFEVITTFVGQMEKPKRQIPTAIIIGGLTVAVMYLLCSFGLGAAIPLDQVSSSSGVMDSLKFLLGQPGQGVMVAIGVLILFTLFVNQLSWIYGVNYVTRYCAESGGGMPRVFAKTNKRGAPIGVSLINGIVASALVLIAPLIPSQELFWSFFALNLVIFLLSFIPMFPAFLRLRQAEPDIERPYRMFGGPRLTRVLAIVPMVILVLAIFFTVVPLSGEELTGKLLLFVGTLLALASGEILARRTARARKD